ncbi:MAG: DegT/DnrJ/EryC1/StrS family aminotransferase [Acidobacteriota bacterium]
MRSIPLLDLRAQYETIKADVDIAIQRSIDKTAFIGGEEHEGFEKEFAGYLGCRACAGVANGTDALVLALRALGVGPGDIVLTTPFTFIATVEAITLNGAVPVFADIDIGSFNVSPECVRLAIESMRPEDRKRLKVILPVHLYGLPGAVHELCAIAEEFGAKVLEDCAQAHGAAVAGKRVGNFGIAGTFSFYPAKNLGAYGDAGAIVSNDHPFIDHVKSLRNHGRTDRYAHAIEGVNSRLDGIQAAVLRVKLRRLDSWNAARRRFAALYNELLAPCARIAVPQVSEGAVVHLYTIRHPERDRLREHLGKQGIAAAVHYPAPLHLQPAYARLGLGEGTYPESERASREVLSLPIYPEMGEEAVRHVASKILEFERV